MAAFQRLDALLLHVSSLDAALLILQHARKKIFVSNNTRRTLSVTNVTSLVFVLDLHLLDNDLHFLDSH